MRRTMETALPISQKLELHPHLWVKLHEHGGLFTWNSSQEATVKKGKDPDFTILRMADS